MRAKFNVARINITHTIVQMMANFKKEDVHAVPNQPTHIRFPRREFGKSAPVKRSFQACWLHYDVGQDAAYCFVCCKAVKEGKMRLSSQTEESFLVKGFINWKDATKVFAKYESCDFHKSTAAALASRVDVADMLSKLQRNSKTCSTC